MKNTQKKKETKEEEEERTDKSKKKEKKKRKEERTTEEQWRRKKKKGQKLRLALTSGSFHVCLITKIEFKCVFSFHNSSLKNQRIE